MNPPVTSEMSKPAVAEKRIEAPPTFKLSRQQRRALERRASKQYGFPVKVQLETFEQEVPQKSPNQ